MVICRSVLLYCPLKYKRASHNLAILKDMTTPYRNRYVCVCVCHPWSHRDAFAFVLPQGPWGAFCICHSVARSFDGSFRVDGHAELDGPPLPFQVSLPVPLGIGTLGRRVAPHSVPYTISQVCLATCQPGMSPQSASRGPVERVYVAVSLALETYVPIAGGGGLGRTSDDFCPIFGIPSWLMPSRDRSGQRWQPSGKPYVVAATKACSRLIGVCRELSPPLLPLPFPFFLCFLGFS